MINDVPIGGRWRVALIHNVHTSPGTSVKSTYDWYRRNYWHQPPTIMMASCYVLIDDATSISTETHNYCLMWWYDSNVINCHRSDWSGEMFSTHCGNSVRSSNKAHLIRGQRAEKALHILQCTVNMCCVYGPPSKKQNSRNTSPEYNDFWGGRSKKGINKSRALHSIPPFTFASSIFCILTTRGAKTSQFHVLVIFCWVMRPVAVIALF